MSNSSKFCTFQILVACGRVSNYVWRDFRLPMSSFSIVVRKSFSGKFTANIDFPIGNFMSDADVGSVKSLLTLFNKYLDHMLMKFEQNRMLRNMQKI